MTQPRSTRATLEAARALIATRRTWTRDAAARDREGRRVRAMNAEAVRFCALGALVRIDGRFEDRAEELLDLASKELFGEPDVVAVNDDPNVSERTSHQRVLRIYDRAIELAAQRRKPPR